MCASSVLSSHPALRRCVSDVMSTLYMSMHDIAYSEINIVASDKMDVKVSRVGHASACQDTCHDMSSHGMDHCMSKAQMSAHDINICVKNKFSYEELMEAV